MRRFLLVVALVALVAPATAAAHATLRSATPRIQSEVARVPREIVLRFDQAVTIGPRSIVVLAADGSTRQGEIVSRDRGRVVAVPVRGLELGVAYTVRWRAASSDGHTVSGVYTFGIGVAAPPPTEAVGSSGTTWKDDAARWILFVSAALLVGTLGFRLLILPAEIPAALERRVNLLATAGAFAAIDAGIVGLILRSANALQLPAVDLLYGDLSPFATKTRFGIAWMVTTLGFAVCATLMLLAWTLDRGRLRWGALAVGSLLLWAFALSGHQATEPNSTKLGEIADWAHLLAAALWVGGVIMLATAVWPLAPELRRHAFLRFSRFATVLVGVLLVAGTVLSIERLQTVSALWSTSYGRILLVKLAIVAIALTWGAAHHFVVRPRLERGNVPRGVGRSLLGESTVVMAALLAAAVLVNGSPPPVETGGAQATLARR